ncbi:archaellin/type IV pilin N-terminal domain-containing protein [Candidatus Aciduliprofundum boonei]|uniref:Flagellin n=1 Tax=Aciduliprofundum boonei (strain DSM 19572 / T469) TaxID=439481 RepID=B5IET4_ACIB4|nr:archaellin/type IV pilin N-terminal domain-containing protein [Candidatus Aciduliprofundum boonei]ADD07956.1 flagellin [Aciduliprofundum boonei T469]EDY35205.1 Archaebacterial flagellin subfamily [Aciduliprofundum boonei T469]HII55175.1 flagellin [Candidatus Aciduliprofundum boonei]
MKKVWNKKEKGEMGIGTLIIFIAMIIVAAVAATVLIQTAYQLQQQAEETGNIAIQDVATGFKIIHVGGIVDNSTPSAPKVGIIQIKVGLIAGSPAIDMRNVLIELTDGTKDVTLNYTNVDITTTAGQVKLAATGEWLANTTFTAKILRDMPPQNWDNQRVVTQGDIVMLIINATAAGLNLTPQSQVTLQIIPKHGVPTYAAFMVPATLTTKYVDLY